MKCVFIKTDRSQCKANTTSSSKYCFRHNEDFREASIVASRKGGLNRRLQGVYGQEIALREPGDVNRFLGNVINSVWTGQVPVQVGTSMGFLARCWLDSYESTKLSDRLKELEEKLERAEYERKFKA